MSGKISKKTEKKKGSFKVKIDESRNDKLTDFGKAILEDRYLLPNESYQ